MAEEKNGNKPRWADEKIITKGPDDDIACRDCIHRLPEISLKSGEKILQYKKVTCAVFKRMKPRDVLWAKAECPFYEKDPEERGDGGPGSGNFGHSGRPGQRGGSGKGGSIVSEESGGYGAAKPFGGCTGKKVKLAGRSYIKTDAHQFSNAVAAAKSKGDPTKTWRVDVHSPEDLEEHYPGASLYVAEDGGTFAVTAERDIISVCSIPRDKGGTAGGKALLAAAVEAGGEKLDSYEGNHGFYEICGFQAVSKCSWNDEYAPDDWKALNENARRNGVQQATGEDICFYRYVGIGNVNRVSTDEVPLYEDYDAAQAARDTEMGD